MLFNSLEFMFLFLPIALVVATRLRGSALLRWIFLASVCFYALTGHAWFVVPMVLTTILDFYLAQYIARAESPRRRRAFLAGSLLASLGLLFYFKYAGLFAGTLQNVAFHVLRQPLDPQASWVRVFTVALPAGISFYTLQTMAYVVDVYRGSAEPETDFWRFAGFVSFFPQLVAGPLSRHCQLIPGLDYIRQHGICPRWKDGVFLFVVGLTKKVLIADRIGHFVDPLLSRPGSLDMVTGWLSLLGFSMQIYFDFSGYSDMAIGLGRLFGIELPQNFKDPYRSANPSDFWRRWHMTLSAWLRDYLYVTLGGNRRGNARRTLNLMVTMLLGGLWHGANWTFACWGVYHGLLLVFYHGFRSTWDGLPSSLQRALTFSLITLGWLLFRSSDMGAAAEWLAALVGFHGLGFGYPKLPKLAFLVLFGLCTVNLVRVNASSYQGYGRLSRPRQSLLAGVAVLAVLWVHESSRFLYYQF